MPDKKRLSRIDLCLVMAQLWQQELRATADDEVAIRNAKQWATTMTPGAFLHQVKHALEEQWEAAPLPSAKPSARWYLTLLDHLEGERYTVWLPDHFLYGPVRRSAAEQVYASISIHSASVALVEGWETIVKTTMPVEQVRQIVQQERHGRYGDPVRVLSGYFAFWKGLEAIDAVIPQGYALLWGSTAQRFYPVEKASDEWGGPLFSPFWKGPTSPDPVRFESSSQGKRRALAFLRRLAKRASPPAPLDAS
jgi:hypothetical protein